MSIYEFGPFRLDAQRLLLVHQGDPLALGPKVVETLLALVEHPGDVLSKTELLDRVWPDGFVEEANLAQNIYVIRKTLKSLWAFDAIATVPRRGYRFVAPVSSVERTEARAPEPELPVVKKADPAPLRRYAFAALALVVAGLVTLGGLAVGHARSNGYVQPTLSADGARLYAMGRYYWNLRTRTGVRTSLRYFANVTKTDPRNALGYAALADANAIVGDYGYGTRSHAFYLQKARAFADRALAVDNRSAQAHASLGLIDDRLMKGDDAQREYRAAIALDPDYAPAHQWYGISLLIQGRSDLAYEQLTTASKLDPLSVATIDWLAQAAYLTRHYGPAIAYAHQTLDLSPQRLDAYEVMGLAYEAKGQYAQAVGAYKTFGRLARQRSEAAALLAHTYAAMHRFSDARAELKIAQSAVGGRAGADPEDVVMAFIAMGQRDEALRLLENETRRYRDDKALIALDPRMDPVRGDSRFRAYTENPA
ncbi:MAG TPA: winged helix-turn-helix domain-containing protein [Candidatus Baltobacteraceae bacterium]|jgi:DNA-binding winged helix-turn-helix (wHTH) protein/Flp pilus assembly protein TadD